jgi:hypothetical protein
MSNPEVQVRLDQDGLGGRTARIHDPGRKIVIDDDLVPAEFSDGTTAAIRAHMISRAAARL